LKDDEAVGKTGLNVNRPMERSTTISNQQKDVQKQGIQNMVACQATSSNLSSHLLIHSMCAGSTQPISLNIWCFQGTQAQQTGAVADCIAHAAIFQPDSNKTETTVLFVAIISPPKCCGPAGNQ
jgi:hypothetical protein